MKISLTRTQWALAILLALATAPYFVRLGASSLWDANEAFYAETPREMIESGDYVNPAFNYHPRLNKPPLSYWVVIPFYKLLGVSEVAERLPIAMGAMIMIATAFALGCLLFSVDAGLLAALCLAIAPRFLMFSRRILIDVLVSMFMALALLVFALAERQPHRRRLFLGLMYICLGLGVITKGPVAALLPAIVLAIYLTVYRKLNALRDLMLPVGLIIVAVIVLPWYVASYLQHGWAHIESFLLKDNLSRYTEQVWGPRRGPFFYIPVLFGDLFPWSFFLLPLLWFGGRQLWQIARGHKDPASGKRSSPEFRHAGLLVIWVVVIVAFFSFSRSKEDLYILPIYPAVAALVGGALASSLSRDRRILVRWTTFALGVVIAAAGVLLLYLFGEGVEPYRLAGAGVVGWSCVVGGVASGGAAILNRVRPAILATAITVTICNWAFASLMLPDFERYKPVRSLCEVIASEASPGDLVGYYQTAYPSMVFYLRRPIFEYYSAGEIESAFSSGKEVFCVMTAVDFEATRARLPAQTRVLASRPIFQVKLRGILDRAEPPQVVLISNKGGTGVKR
ncbi:MAG TPA: glycosyltransferase family 39 protein [Blastocatellia bacterium]|nr:glycosyltransferase family 39 protein [Blastocatellia bacterium]